MLEVLSESAPAFVALVFAVALLLGSFLNVVIYRLPIMMEREWREQAAELIDTPPESELPEDRFDLIVPRSRCPSCGTAITALQNIPLLSYLVLKGKCAACGTSISARYPLVELMTAVMAALCAWHFGPGWEALAAIALTMVLIPIAMIDADTTYIFDSLVLPLMWAGLALSLFHPMPEAKALFVAPSDAILGAMAGYLILWSVFWVFKLITGKDGMGYGDFKLLAALGAWLGWQQLPLIILLSAAVGAVINIAMIVFRGRDRAIPIPFGPYLAAAGWIAMLWGEAITTAYLDLMM